MKKKIYEADFVEKLNESYVIKKMSTTEIAKNSIDIFGRSISASTIYGDLIKNNIPLRDKSESVAMACGELDKSKSYLTEDVIEWIDGLMLGDGYINFKKPNHATSRFRLDSSQQEWAVYGFSKLGDYSPRGVSVYGKISERCPNAIWMNQTLTHPDITIQAKRWYFGDNQTKRIPSDVRITPTSMLLWYLGDGSLTFIEESNTYVLRFATCSFDPNDVENILMVKLQALGLNCSRDKWKNDIRICADSIGKFFDVIGHKSPISCYDYKFDIPDWLRMIRLSDIVKTDQEKWRAQSWYKNGNLECSKSPGGKMLLFTKEQADRLRSRLDS